jgi:hypothetical protein
MALNVEGVMDRGMHAGCRYQHRLSGGTRTGCGNGSSTSPLAARAHGNGSSDTNGSDLWIELFVAQFDAASLLCRPRTGLCKIELATDSPLEGNGFEPSVPLLPFRDGGTKGGATYKV